MNTLQKQPTREILIGVDPQNDFISGTLAVAEGEQVIQPLNHVAEMVRGSGGKAIWTRDWHPASTPHFEQWPVHCVAGTNGAAYPPDLRIEAQDVILSKGMGQTDGYSGVEGVSDKGETLETLITPKSPLEQVRIFIGGLATDYCVKATAIDLADRYRDDSAVSLYLIRDAVQAVNLQPSDGADALSAIHDAGVEALTSDQIRERFFKQRGMTL